MALTALQKQKVKNWSSELFRYLTEVLPKDTTPQRIKANRDRLLPLLAERYDIESLKSQITPAQASVLKNLVSLLYEWEHYFDKGYRSSENIDTLPDKIKTILAGIVRADL